MPGENQNNTDGFNEPKIDLSNPAFENQTDPKQESASSQPSFQPVSNAGDGISHANADTNPSITSEQPEPPKEDFQSSFSNEMMYEDERTAPDFKKILIIFGAVVLFLGITLGGYAFLKGKQKPAEEEVTEEADETEEESAEESTTTGNTPSTPQTPAPETPAVQTPVPAAQPKIEIPQPEMQTPDENGAVNGTG